MTLVGTTVGRIRVVEALGKGGMGEVYAGYDEKLKRKVALKSIRDERRLDAEAKARFLREARILSQLDHPAICRIYELVEGEDCDFLVLELIPGKSLKQAMDEDELDDAFKLHVAERVTEALMVAHAQGVAHRDLKPENVMLTPEGGVKVLDFGLAYAPDAGLMTALDGGGFGDAVEPRDAGREEDAAGTSATVVQGGRLAGTADAGEPLEPTMVWSGPQPTLGADLEATGSAATQPATRRPAATRSAATRSGGPTPDSDPGTASDFVETEHGIVMGTVAYMSPEQARGERVTVAGDLYSLGLLMQELFTGRSSYKEGLALLQMLRSAASATTLPATGVDPDLGELIERLKSLDPADRPSAVETAERLRWIRGKPGRRLLRRLAAVLVAVLLLGGFKYTFDLRRERAEAQAARREAEEVLEFVVGLFAVSNPETARGREITARELLDAGAAEIAGALRDQPRSRSRLMLTMGRIYRQLGDYDQSGPLLEEGLAVRTRELGEDDLELAAGLDSLASLYHDQGEYQRAEPLFARALAIREQALGSERALVAVSLNNLAFHYLESGQPEAAEPLLQRALEAQSLAAGGEHQGVANSLINLGELYRGRGDLDRAETYFGRALELQERLLPAGHPDLAFSLNSLAMIHHAQGDAGQAEPLFRRTLEIQQQVLGAGHPNVAVSLNNLAELYRGAGDYSQAEPLYGRALEIQEQSLGPDHPAVAITLSNLGDLHRARGDAARAEPLYARALAIQEAALGADHPSVAVTLNHQADLHLAGADPARSQVLYARTLEIQEQAFGPDHLSVAITLSDLAGLHLRAGWLPEAEKLYLRARATTRQILAGDAANRTGRRLLAEIHLGLGRLYQATGAADRAVESWTEALALIGPLASGSTDVAALHVHALALLHLGRVEEARPLAAKLLYIGWSHPDLLELCQEHGLFDEP